MDDLISRRAAIDALNEYFARIGQLKRRGLNKGEKAISLDTVETIKTLPSAQPEIIRCRECKHWREDHTCREHSLVTPMMAYEFCSRAERREE